MKRSLIQFITLFLLAGLAAACAQRRAVPPPDIDNSFQGAIDRIDRAHQLVTVQHWPLYKTFQVGPGCDITIPDRTDSTLADLKPGDFVIVAYQGTGRILEATRIARRSREYIREKEEQYERLQEMLNPSPNQ